MKKSFKLLFAALFALASFTSAQAAELTVFEGTATNTKVPIYGMYMDTQGTRVQVMYPESALTDMVGLPINSVKFYTDADGITLTGGNVEVLVGTTTQTAFPSSGATPIEGLTHVANITLNPGDTELLIKFEEPFVYNGGSLVIETNVLEKTDEYANIYFLGVEQYGSYNAVTYTYSWATVSFYPMATFDYTPADYAAAVTPAELAFGRLYPDQEAEPKTFTIKNNGLNAFTPIFSGVEAPFSVTPAPAEIASGVVVTYTVAFAPTALGEYNQTLAIDCGAAGQFQVALSGAQVERPVELVVADGETTNKMVPVDPENYEHVGGGGFSQMIYPAEMLADLAGKKITGIKFHTTKAMTLNGGNIQLSLKEVEEGSFASATAITDMTVVANGAPVAGETELVFEFTQPYVYNGGNLAIEALVTANGNYSFSDAYLGVASENAAYAHIYNFGWEDGLVSFLPKATISYEKGDTPEPEVKRGDVNKDNVVNIADVTALIDMLLSGAEMIPEADCNKDNVMNIADVTSLIDFLLSGTW